MSDPLLLHASTSITAQRITNTVDVRAVAKNSTYFATFGGEIVQ